MVNLSFDDKKIHRLAMGMVLERDIIIVIGSGIIVSICCWTGYIHR